MKHVTLLWDLYKLKNNTKKSHTKMQVLQTKKLYALLQYAYDHSPYYKAAFHAAGITKQSIHTTPISMFPKMNKELLMQNFDELVTISDIKQSALHTFDEEEHVDEVYKNGYHVVHSSGSTGQPNYFIYDEFAWNQMLSAILRGALWDMNMLAILRLLWKTPRIVYIAATDSRYGGAMAVRSGIKGIYAKQLSLDIKQPVNEWIQQIQTFRPTIIIGYASAIKILAECIVSGNIHIHVERVISCGEPLNKNLRNYLEQVFQCVVVNFYGASESLALGVETHADEGMYLFDDMNYIEVDDGKMYLTSLYNYAQPIIRYELSDHLRMDAKDQHYPFTKIKNITGRDEDLMWFEDQNGHREFLHPLAIEGFCIKHMLDYQFIQINQTSFELDIEVSKEANTYKIQQEMTNAIQTMLQRKQLDYVTFVVMFVDAILTDKKTGKKALIIQKERVRI